MTAHRRAYLRAQYRRWKAEGRCWGCGKIARPDRTTCEACGEKQAAASLARYHAQKGRTAA